MAETGWLKRVRGAIGMGLTWAAGWAVAGVLIGVTSLLTPGLPWNAFFRFYDAPLPSLAMPGFIGGVIFSVVLGIAANRRSLDELSVPRFAAWGALSGLLLSAIPDLLVLAGTATRSETAAGVGTLTAIIALPLVTLCAVSAAGSLLLARRARRRDLIAARKSLGLRAAEAQGSLSTSAPDLLARLARERSHATSDRP